MNMGVNCQRQKYKGDLYEFSQRFAAYEASNCSGAAKIGNFSLHFSDILRCVAFCNILYV